MGARTAFLSSMALVFALWVASALINASVPLTPLKTVASLRKGDAVRVQALAVDVRFFRSRQGHRHVRFSLVDDSEKVSAIMFEGTHTPRQVDRLRSGGTVVVEATVDTWRGRVSLQVMSVR